MSWIKGEDFDFNDFLLTERFLIRQMFGDIGNNSAEDTVYLRNMGIALKYNPVVKWYFMKKCPERAECNYSRWLLMKLKKDGFTEPSGDKRVKNIELVFSER